jgi:chemotaxis protein methyltransferase CheR
MPVPLTDDEFRRFSEWLASEYGIRFGPEKREILRARLEQRRAALALDSFDRLLFYVRYDPRREEERDRLIASLTNKESYFFRERTQLDMLRSEVLPSLAQERRPGGGPIRILSMGAAAGQEPYTLAIVAREALAGTGIPFQVTGMDVDPGALDLARTGEYRAHSLRGMPEEVVDEYFLAVDGGWRLREEIREAARFQRGNLVDPAWTETVPPQDVIFCRNVLIYFREEAVHRAVRNLYRVVRPGGFLFLGHAESLTRVPTRFVAQRRPGAVFYRRVEE